MCGRWYIPKKSEFWNNPRFYGGDSFLGAIHLWQWVGLTERNNLFWSGQRSFTLYSCETSLYEIDTRRLLARAKWYSCTLPNHKNLPRLSLSRGITLHSRKSTSESPRHLREVLIIYLMVNASVAIFFSANQNLPTWPACQIAFSYIASFMSTCNTHRWRSPHSFITLMIIKETNIKYSQSY